jgi:hypothetical protein
MYSPAILLAFPSAANIGTKEKLYKFLSDSIHVTRILVHKTDLTNILGAIPLTRFYMTGPDEADEADEHTKKISDAGYWTLKKRTEETDMHRIYIVGGRSIKADSDTQNAIMEAVDYKLPDKKRHLVSIQEEGLLASNLWERTLQNELAYAKAANNPYTLVALDIAKRDTRGIVYTVIKILAEVQSKGAPAPHIVLFNSNDPGVVNAHGIDLYTLYTLDELNRALGAVGPVGGSAPVIRDEDHVAPHPAKTSLSTVNKRKVLFMIFIEVPSAGKIEESRLKAISGGGYDDIIHAEITETDDSYIDRMLVSLKHEIERNTEDRSDDEYTLMVCNTGLPIHENVIAKVCEFVRRIGSDGNHKIMQFLFSKATYDHVVGITPKDVLYHDIKDKAPAGFVALRRRGATASEKRIFIAMESADDFNYTQILLRKVQDIIMDLVDKERPQLAGFQADVGLAFMEGKRGEFTNRVASYNTLARASQSEVPYVFMAIAVDTVRDAANVSDVLSSYIQLIDESVTNEKHKRGIFIVVLDKTYTTYEGPIGLTSKVKIGSYELQTLRCYPFADFKRAFPRAQGPVPPAAASPVDSGILTLAHEAANVAAEMGDQAAAAIVLNDARDDTVPVPDSLPKGPISPVESAQAAPGSSRRKKGDRARPVVRDRDRAAIDKAEKRRINTIELQKVIKIRRMIMRAVNKAEPPSRKEKLTALVAEPMTEQDAIILIQRMTIQHKEDLTRLESFCCNNDTYRPDTKGQYDTLRSLNSALSDITALIHRESTRAGAIFEKIYRPEIETVKKCVELRRGEYTDYQREIAEVRRNLDMEKLQNAQRERDIISLTAELTTQNIVLRATDRVVAGAEPPIAEIKPELERASSAAISRADREGNQLALIEACVLSVGARAVREGSSPAVTAALYAVLQAQSTPEGLARAFAEEAKSHKLRSPRRLFFAKDGVASVFRKSIISSINTSPTKLRFAMCGPLSTGATDIIFERLVVDENERKYVEYMDLPPLLITTGRGWKKGQAYSHIVIGKNCGHTDIHGAFYLVSYQLHASISVSVVVSPTAVENTQKAVFDNLRVNPEVTQLDSSSTLITLRKKAILDVERSFSADSSASAPGAIVPSEQAHAAGGNPDQMNQKLVRKKVYILRDNQDENEINDLISKYGLRNEDGYDLAGTTADYSAISTITQPDRTLLVMKKDDKLAKRTGLLLFTKVILPPRQAKRGFLGVFSNTGDSYDELRNRMTTNGVYAATDKDKNVYVLSKLVIYELSRDGSELAPHVVQNIISTFRPFEDNLKHIIERKNLAKDAATLDTCHFAVLNRESIENLNQAIEYISNGANKPERIVLCCKGTKVDPEEIQAFQSIGGSTYALVANADVKVLGAGLIGGLFTLNKRQSNKFGAFV